MGRYLYSVHSFVCWLVKFNLPLKVSHVQLCAISFSSSQGNKPPKCQIKKLRLQRYLPENVVHFMDSLFAFGIVLSTAFLCFNFNYRNVRWNNLFKERPCSYSHGWTRAYQSMEIPASASIRCSFQCSGENANKVYWSVKSLGQWFLHDSMIFFSFRGVGGGGGGSLGLKNFRQGSLKETI